MTRMMKKPLRFKTRKFQKNPFSGKNTAGKIIGPRAKGVRRSSPKYGRGK